MAEPWRFGPFARMISITCESGTFLAIPTSATQTLDQHVFERSGTWTATANNTPAGRNNYWYNPARLDLPILSYVGIPSRYFAAYLKPDTDAATGLETVTNVGVSLTTAIYALGKHIATAPSNVIAAGIRPLSGGNYRLIALCAASNGDIGLHIYYSDVSDLAFSTLIEAGDWVQMSVPDAIIPGGNRYSSPWFLNASCTEAACTRIQDVEPRRFFDVETTVYHRHVVRADIGLDAFTMTDEGNLAPPWRDVEAALPPQGGESGVIENDWVLRLERECSYNDLGPDHPDPCERTGFEYWTRRKKQTWPPRTAYDEDLILAVDYIGDTRTHVRSHVSIYQRQITLKIVDRRVWGKFCQDWLAGWEDAVSAGPYGFPLVGFSNPDGDTTPCTDQNPFYLGNEIIFSGTYPVGTDVRMRFDSMPGVEVPVRIDTETRTDELRWWGGELTVVSDEVDAAGLVTFADLRAKIVSWLNQPVLDNGGAGPMYPSVKTATAAVELGPAPSETRVEGVSPPLIYHDNRYLPSRNAVRDQMGNVFYSFRWIINGQTFVANHLTGADPVALTGLTGDHPRFTNLGVY